MSFLNVQNVALRYVLCYKENATCHVHLLLTLLFVRLRNYLESPLDVSQDVNYTLYVYVVKAENDIILNILSETF